MTTSLPSGSPPVALEPSLPPEPPETHLLASSPPGAASPGPVRRGFGPVALVLVALLSAAAAGPAGYLFAKHEHGSGPAGEEASARYQCPMHPTIVQDHPGDCPICGMKLVKMGGAGGAGEDDGHASDSSVHGLATVDIDPARQQLIGLRTAAVTRGKVSGAWRTVGRVAVDETRVRHINIKVPVYVERVFVDFVGKPVKKGAALFSGYSPELLTAQEEYRIALAADKSMGQSAGLSPSHGGLAASAKRKLQLWDVPKATIDKLEQGGEAQRTITFHSPIAGVVTKKDVVDGMKLDAGAMPYEIVDLTRVWVLADIYEADLHRVAVGMGAKLRLKAYPNREFEGTAAFLDPVLDPMTRTLKLRLEFANPDGELRPELFGEVQLESGERDGLEIPEDAVIYSGTKKVVFVALGEGKLQPREISTGDSDGTHVEVTAGLAEGEKVVVRANFLVDSESRLKASLAALSSPPPDGAGHAGHSQGAPAASPQAGPAASASPASGSPQEGPTAQKSKPGTTSGAIAPAAKGAEFACPMHPEVTDEKASRCPKCGMFLTAVKPKSGSAQRDEAAPKQQTAPVEPAKPAFACPMHPEVTDSEASRCPKCGMFLTPTERKPQ